VKLFFRTAIAVNSQLSRPELNKKMYFSPGTKCVKVHFSRVYGENEQKNEKQFFSVKNEQKLVFPYHILDKTDKNLIKICEKRTKNGEKRTKKNN
jgi:hypothetical protein